MSEPPPAAAGLNAPSHCRSVSSPAVLSCTGVLAAPRPLRIVLGLPRCHTWPLDLSEADLPVRCAAPVADVPSPLTAQRAAAAAAAAAVQVEVELGPRFSPASIPPSLHRSSASQSSHGFEGSAALPPRSGVHSRRTSSQLLSGDAAVTSHPPSPFVGLQSISLGEGVLMMPSALTHPLPLDPTTLPPCTPQTGVVPTPPRLTGSTSQISLQEQWSGGAAHAPAPAPEIPKLRVRVSSSGEQAVEQVMATQSSASSQSVTPRSRTLRRKRQQRRRFDANLVEQLQQQAHTPIRVEVDEPGEDSARTDEDEEGEGGAAPAETTPLAASYRIAIAQQATPKDRTGTNSKTTSPRAGPDVAAAAAPAVVGKRWYRKKRVMLPLLCILCVILSFIIALIVLFPSSPSVTTTSVRISELQWRAEDDGALTANLTLAVSVQLKNSNKFGADFEASAVDAFVTLPPSAGSTTQKVATLQLPPGYIGPQSELSLFLQERLYDVRLAQSSDLPALLQHMQVSSSSQTRGRMSFLGLGVPFTVRTRCSAVCSVNAATLEVTILEQACDSSTGTG